MPTRPYLCQQANDWVYCSGPTRSYLGPTFANEQAIGFIALSLVGPTLGLPLSTSNSLGWLHWSESAYLGLTFANTRVIWFFGVGLLGPTLGLPLPTIKSLGLLVWAYSGLPWAYLCQWAKHWVYCSGPTRAYLEATFANQPILLNKIWFRI